MKLSILTFALFPAVVCGYSMRVHDALGRPFTIQGPTRSRAGVSYSTAQSARDAFRPQKRSVDEAFDELMDDLNRCKGSEKTISKSKEWVDRSFRLFSELNRDSASSEAEIKRNEEMLQKQQKWANKLVDFVAELGQDLSTMKPSTDVRRTPSDAATEEKGSIVSLGTDIVPIYSIHDDATIFQVELELPGVSMEDIDVQLEKETNVLYISGQRRVVGSAAATKFSKRFMLESTVDTQNISAKLNNGILTVTAQKKSKENDNKKRIPVVVGE